MDRLAIGLAAGQTMAMSILSRRTVIAGAAFALSYGLGAPQAWTASAVTRGPRFRLGVNLAGAEFKKIGGRWRWPKLDNLRYYLDNGFNIFRLPFKWDRLQPELNEPLLEEALAGLDEIVDLATGAGAVVVLDSHDYGRRDGQVIGDPGSTVSAADFADFWGRIARRYRTNDLVWYGLMNEPHGEDPMVNLSVQNAACAAIRAAGAKSKVLFSGVSWTKANTWLRSSNAEVMLQVRDPENNFAFDAHQYIDQGVGGAPKGPARPGIGSRVLEDIYKWGRQHQRQVFLGEFASGQYPASLKELRALVAFMKERSDVFIGATYFAGGGTWGKSPNSADPVNGVDKPQTLLMERFLPK